MRNLLGSIAVVVLFATTSSFAQAPAPAAQDGPGARGPAAAGAPGGGRGGGRGGARGGDAAGGAGRAARVPVIPAVPMLAYVSAPEPQPPAGMEYGAVAGISVNSKGHMFLFQRTAHSLLEFDQNDKFVREIPVDMTRAHSLRIDSKDNIWLVDDGAHTVKKLSPDGKLLMTLGVKGEAGTWDEATGVHKFNQPTDIAFGLNGEFYVSTGHGGPDPRVLRFDKNGKFIKTWDLKHADGSNANIHTITADRKGNVYAGDREVMLIRVYDREGKHLRDIKMPNLVCSFFVDSKDNLWMTAGQDGMIMRLDWNGNILGWTGKLGRGPNEYGEAHYMTISRDLKRMYVADTVDNRIQKLVLGVR